MSAIYVISLSSTFWNIYVYINIYLIKLCILFCSITIKIRPPRCETSWRTSLQLFGENAAYRQIDKRRRFVGFSHKNWIRVHIRRPASQGALSAYIKHSQTLLRFKLHYHRSLNTIHNFYLSLIMYFKFCI